MITLDSEDLDDHQSRLLDVLCEAFEAAPRLDAVNGPGLYHSLRTHLAAAGATDQVFESRGVKLFVDPISIQYLKNAEVDFVDTITGGGFTIKNPNAKSTCGCGSSFSTE